jgi:magnesium transporter
VPSIRPSRAPARAPCKSQIVAFDFEHKRERSLSFGQIEGAIANGEFVWVDVEATEPRQARGLLESLAIDAAIIDSALGDEGPATHQARYEGFLHLALSGCRACDDHFELERVDAVIGERMLVLVHRGPVAFLEAVRGDYKADFVSFARSPSFLLYELCDHLLDNYQAVQAELQDRVEELRASLRSGEVEELVFSRVSLLSEDLLQFRRILLPARTVLTDLSTRRSKFVSQASQPFLAGMVSRLEHVLQDLLVDRDILSESVNLYVSLVSHRTNGVMRRLTGVSIIFLPLSFIVGVYGMNFDTQPEIHWQHGYLYFWGVVVAVTAGLLLVMRRSRLM